MKSTIPPNMVDIFPYFLFNVSPKFNPKYVNSMLVTQNTVDEKMQFLVINDNPIPVVKLSILTDNPNIKISADDLIYGNVKRNLLLVSLKLDIIISTAIRDNIMPTKMLVFIRILLVIKFPIITPIKGIMK